MAPARTGQLTVNRLISCSKRGSFRSGSKPGQSRRNGIVTSIMELAFGPDGTLYVVEFDEAGWLGVEGNGFARTAAGGTVNACNVATGACSVKASGLLLPTAVAVDHTGALWVVEHAPMLFVAASVRRLP